MAGTVIRRPLWQDAVNYGLLIVVNLLERWIGIGGADEAGVDQGGQDIRRPKVSADGVAGFLNGALGDLHPLRIKLWVVQLGIGGVQTGGIDVGRVVEEQVWEIVRIGLETQAAGRAIFDQPV